jgi:hypothetical protein
MGSGSIVDFNSSRRFAADKIHLHGRPQPAHLPQALGTNGRGLILEIGSKDYGAAASFREFYAGAEYVGLEMSEAKGVDVVADLAKSLGPLKEDYFDLGICLMVNMLGTRRAGAA